MTESATGNLSAAKSPRDIVPVLAVEQVEFVPSTRRNPEADSVRRCEVSGWYGLLVSALKVIGVFAAVATAARGFVAFGSWRTSLRNRLIGIEPRRQETS